MGYPVGGVFIVAEIWKFALDHLQALQLLSNSNIYFLSPVESAIVQECEQFLEILDKLLVLVAFEISDRFDEFVEVLDFYHQGCQF